MYEGYGQNVISPPYYTINLNNSERTSNTMRINIDGKNTFDLNLQMNIVDDLVKDVKLLKEQVEELRMRVTGMELAPGGPLYLQAKEHFTELSQIK